MDKSERLPESFFEFKKINSFFFTYENNNTYNSHGLSDALEYRKLATPKDALKRSVSEAHALTIRTLGSGCFSNFCFSIIYRGKPFSVII